MHYMSQDTFLVTLGTGVPAHTAICGTLMSSTLSIDARGCTVQGIDVIEAILELLVMHVVADASDVRSSSKQRDDMMQENG